MAKASKKLKQRSLSVEHVEDVHHANERVVFLNLKCMEGRIVLAISPADLRYIAGFSARQLAFRAVDAKAKLELHK